MASIGLYHDQNLECIPADSQIISFLDVENYILLAVLLKTGGVEMFSSTWLMPICAGKNGSYSNPLSSSGCHGRPIAD
jgi:hypothetical protein